MTVLASMSAKLAFTCGDPAGVGPEIIAAWLAAHRAEAREVAVIGPGRWLAAGVANRDGRLRPFTPDFARRALPD